MPSEAAYRAAILGFLRGVRTGEVKVTETGPYMAMQITFACGVLGHPPKFEKPWEEKEDFERGCFCSARGSI